MKQIKSRPDPLEILNPGRFVVLIPTDGPSGSTNDPRPVPPPSRGR